MQLRDLKVSKGIEIFVTRDEYRYHLASKVEATEPGRVYISLIASGQRVFAFKHSDYVEILYKEKDRMWKWEGVKAGISQLDGFQVHYFESFKEGISFNRRDTFRVKIMTATELTRFTPINGGVNMGDFDMEAEAKELIAVGIEKSIINVVVKDISESGIGFYSPIKMRTGDCVRVCFMTELGSFVCEGIVIREVEQIWGKFRLFYGCSFTKTDKHLSRYIFAEQRKQLQKERQGD